MGLLDLELLGTVPIPVIILIDLIRFLPQTLLLAFHVNIKMSSSSIVFLFRQESPLRGTVIWYLNCSFQQKNDHLITTTHKVNN